ncbi:efflux transporter outer membrane subunit [Phenylobacterium sp.]|jgi:multidrug efflux system outer membrane protein|uniref:efflux transporter outer membrane subunit n=1 Tax=Phenylobacterium sp. TaxID=1871053 RepID=UPI002E34A558|nr:efflux transporter outer membrane subunit [Phenylobacterium sp.]HEX4710148.1 efflux transporter outer membrane subunit [Phenylobacterium sp.]
MTVYRLPALVPALSLVSLLLAGCAVGPTYHPPSEPPVALAAAPRLTPEPVDGDWWRTFGDPQLDQLIQRGLGANLDVRAAIDRVRAARALFRGSELDLLPHVDATASYQASRQQVPGFTAGPVSVRQASLGLDAAWELDLFGRVRHEVEAAHADAQAAEADLRGAQVLVAAEIARNYIALRGAQARRAVAEDNARTASDTLRLTGVRREVGAGDPIDLESAKARLSATQATIPPLRMREAEAAHRLAVLIGVRPGELDAELATPAATVAEPPSALPIGDATGFLKRRPDVQAAERRLSAETARTGMATADLFPRVTVTGFVGFLTGDVSALFKSGSRAWSVSPQLSWPGLDIGSATARLSAQRAQEDASLAAYRQTALRAVEDLQNALVDYRERQTQVVSLVEQVAASRRAAELAHIRYQEGRIDFLRVLDAERTRLEAEDALSAAQTDANLDVVAIYKALGG